MVNSKESATIKEAKFIIWDETSMANTTHALMAVDRLLKDMGNNVFLEEKLYFLEVILDRYWL